MSSSIYIHDPPLNLTGLTKNNAWQEDYDLNSVLQHSDPKMVVMLVRNNSATQNRRSGLRPVASGLSDSLTISTGPTDHTRQTAVSLNGGTTIDYLLHTSDLDLYLLYEFGGDEFVAYGDHVDLGTGSPNAWRTQDETARMGADAGDGSAVVLNVIGLATSWQWGFRAFGSTDNFVPSINNTNSFFGIAGLDSQDRYETFQKRTGGKSPTYVSRIQSCGFFKSGIFNAVDPPVNISLDNP
jgi:hypothetical protein